MSTQETTNATPVTVDVQAVLAMLKAGTSRKDINAHYGLPDSIADKTIWQHPQLFRKRPKKQYNVQFVNETPQGAAVAATTQAVEFEQETAQETVEEAVQEVAEETVSDWNAPATHQED